MKTLVLSNKYWLEGDLKVNFEYSKLVIAHYAKSFYYSSQFFPKERRWAAYAVYSFCRYADNLIDNPRQRNKELVLKELAEFKVEYELAYRYRESNHPALAAFIKVADIFNIPKEYGLDLIDGVAMDIDIKQYNTFDELYVFCYRVASVVGLMMTHIMGFSGGSNTLKSAEYLGIAMQLTNILRDVKEDKNMGRVYIPLQDLEQFGLNKSDIINENFNDNFKNLMIFQCNRAKEYYEKSTLGIKMLHKDSRFAIYTASNIYEGILAKIEENNYNPFVGRAYVSKSRKNLITFTQLTKHFLRKVNLYND